jgi:deoxyribodipyrimidine photo-lyase
MAQAIVWFRRDLRLADNPALWAALEAGLAPIPVYIHAPDEDAPWQPGAASSAWLARSLRALDDDLRKLGSRLLVLRGPSLPALERLAASSGAEAVLWNRLYEPASRARDGAVKQALRERGLAVHSHNAALLAEPWTVATLNGEPYRVFTPFWRNAGQHVAAVAPRAAPTQLPTPEHDVESIAVDALALEPLLDWDRGFWTRWQPGEAGAQDLLEAFVEGAAHGYGEQRNLPDRAGTSRLSPHLHFGEISPRQIARRVLDARAPAVPEGDRARYLAELGWREFSHHLLYHFPHSAERDLTGKFDRFEWVDPDPVVLRRWQQGRTGIPLVDAGMRELWHTGWMHNRVRMVVASLLTKNLRCHWRHGARWFWDTLVDADLAQNTQGWQWSAGTGADAAPYFRIFSPTSQATRFDPDARYIRRWVPELRNLPTPALFEPWTQPALARSLAPDYPTAPVLDLRRSREDALLAHQRMK